MILKGRWEAKEKDEVVHFLLKQIPNRGKVKVATGALKVDMYFSGNALLRFEINGIPLRRMWEIKGTLLSLLDKSSAEFTISDHITDLKGYMKVPFPALMMEVMALKDAIVHYGSTMQRFSGVFRIHSVPKGGDEEEFARTLSLRYKNDVPLNRLYRDYFFVHPAYIGGLISRLIEGGYAAVQGENRGEGISPAMLLILVLLTLVVSAISAAVSVFLIMRIL